MAAASGGLYLYCIIGTGEARNFGDLGIGGRGDPVTTIPYRDLGAVVSSIPMDRYAVGQATMLAHERVLEKVMADHTLLPVRFYTIAPNAEEVRSLLRTQHGSFKQLLRALDNKMELGLKALWRDMSPVFAAILETGPQQLYTAEFAERAEKERVGSFSASSAVNDYRAEASQRLRLDLDQERAKTGERLMAPLRPLAVDLRLNRTYGDDMIVNAAFLVDRSREREFDLRLGELEARYAHAIDFKYVGPVPPFSFVNIVIREEAAS